MQGSKCDRKENIACHGHPKERGPPIRLHGANSGGRWQPDVSGDETFDLTATGRVRVGWAHLPKGLAKGRTLDLGGGEKGKYICIAKPLYFAQF